MATDLPRGTSPTGEPDDLDEVDGIDDGVRPAVPPTRPLSVWGDAAREHPSLAEYGTPPSTAPAPAPFLAPPPAPDLAPDRTAPAAPRPAARIPITAGPRPTGPPARSALAATVTTFLARTRAARTPPVGRFGALPVLPIALVGLLLLVIVALFAVSRPGAAPVARSSPTSSLAAGGVTASATIAPTSTGTRASSRPSATATAEKSASASARTYKVQAGDTLAKIARRFGTTAAELQRLNNITDPRLIHIGDVLQIP